MGRGRKPALMEVHKGDDVAIRRPQCHRAKSTLWLRSSRREDRVGRDPPCVGAGPRNCTTAPWKAGVEEHEFANGEDARTKNPITGSSRN
jgi:hypothetical protein